jgi:hypothetical protein
VLVTWPLTRRRTTFPVEHRRCDSGMSYYVCSDRRRCFLGAFPTLCASPGAAAFWNLISGSCGNGPFLACECVGGIGTDRPELFFSLDISGERNKKRMVRDENGNTSPRGPFRRSHQRNHNELKELARSSGVRISSSVCGPCLFRKRPSTEKLWGKTAKRSPAAEATMVMGT